MEDDLKRVNEAGLRQRHSFNSVSAQEWVKFWGPILAARQFHVKGKYLWAEADVQGELFCFRLHPILVYVADHTDWLYFLLCRPLCPPILC
jgi:hypothetical protein